jgi:hypothetical protein
MCSVPLASGSSDMIIIEDDDLEGEGEFQGENRY